MMLPMIGVFKVSHALLNVFKIYSEGFILAPPL